MTLSVSTHHTTPCSPLEDLWDDRQTIPRTITFNSSLNKTDLYLINNNVLKNKICVSLLYPSYGGKMPTSWKGVGVTDSNMCYLKLPCKWNFSLKANLRTLRYLPLSRLLNRTINEVEILFTRWITTLLIISSFLFFSYWLFPRPPAPAASHSIHWFGSLFKQSCLKVIISQVRIWPKLAMVWVQGNSHIWVANCQHGAYSPHSQNSRSKSVRSLWWVL